MVQQKLIATNENVPKFISSSNNISFCNITKGIKLKAKKSSITFKFDFEDIDKLIFHIKKISGNGKLSIKIDNFDKEYIITNTTQIKIPYLNSVTITRGKNSTGDVSILAIYCESKFNINDEMIGVVTKNLPEKEENIEESLKQYLYKMKNHKIYDKIIFFNQMRNGDVHVSRNFVKYLMTKLKAKEYFYMHNNPPELLADIDNLKYLDNLSILIDPFINYMLIDNTLYINTWIGQLNFKYCQPQGCTLDGNMSLYSDQLANFSKRINCSKEKLLPKIDYSKFFIKNIDNFMADKKDKIKVFISNGDCMSEQSENFNFDMAINEFSSKYKNVLFFVSNPTEIIKENVFYNADIIKSGKPDLNENSYISTFCDIIIGRSSGSYTFSLVADNLLDEKKIFVSFTYKEAEGIWYPESKSKIIWSDDFNPINIEETIDKVISLKIT